MLHCVNGSPVKPSMHVQIGRWFNTWHWAFIPHEPGHGSAHLWLTHARWLLHSELKTHSGRHCGGTPM